VGEENCIKNIDCAKKCTKTAREKKSETPFEPKPQTPPLPK
jgi:hypothetical protein